MQQITGKEYHIEKILEEWISSMKSWEKCSTVEIKQCYMLHLYRQTGWHKYVEREVSTTPTSIASQEEEGIFLAAIVDINEQGQLLLRHDNGEEKLYHFKQIRFVI